MKIIYDNIIYFLQRSGGGSVYWTELAKRMNEKQEDDVVFTEPKAECTNIFRKNQTFRKILFEKKIPLILLRFFNLTLDFNEKFIFHSSYYRISGSGNALNFVTIHDFTSELFYTGIRRFVHYTRKKKAINRADGIICISENTKNDLLKFHPKTSTGKIRVIYNGVGNEFYKLPSETDFSDFKFPEILKSKYIIYIGHRSSYKNFDTAVKSVELSDNSFRLLVIGEAINENEKNLLDKHLKGRYDVLSGIFSSNLNIFYNRAFCLLYPSSYEGFGIPVLEAMKTGCPVVTTNKSSLPEVAGDAAVMVDEIRPEKFAEEIRKLENPEYRNTLIEKGFEQSRKFSWDKCFNEVYQFYSDNYHKKI
jgi:mannosyltransferase